MRIGDSIKVKPGILCPDNESYNLSGWEGRIIGIDQGLIEIEWDSITLSQMPKEFIQESIDEGIEYKCMILGESEIEITKPRDKQEDVQKKQDIIRFNYSFEGEEARIKKILNNEDISVNANNLETYYKYLRDNLEKPCVLTGMEDFSWEEPYLIGGWSKKEYNEHQERRQIQGLRRYSLFH